jgi:hypothetical protein
MKKRILLGAVVAAILSVLFAGTALAQVSKVVYPRGNSDPRACTITEWKVLPDGSVQYSLDTAPNGFSAAVVEVGKHGEPVLTTFDNEDKYNAYLIAEGQQPLPPLKISNANQLQPLSVGNAHCGSNVKVDQNGTEYMVIEDQAYSNFSWSGSSVTYYQPWYGNNVWTHFSWMILNGPYYTPPSIPSANALGTYNTSYVKSDGTYCWITHRNRAQPNYPSSSIEGSIIPTGYHVHVYASNGPGWVNQ